MPRDVNEEARKHAHSLPDTEPDEQSRRECKKAETLFAHLKGNPLSAKVDTANPNSIDFFNGISQKQTLSLFSRLSVTSSSDDLAPCHLAGLR